MKTKYAFHLLFHLNYVSHHENFNTNQYIILNIEREMLDKANA